MPGLASPSTWGWKRRITSAMSSFSIVRSGMPSGMLKNTWTPSESACGRKSSFGARSHVNSAGSVTSETIHALRRRGVAVSRTIADVALSQTCSSRSIATSPVPKCLLATGSTVMAAIMDMATATDSVSARSANNCPSSPSMNRIGRKMAILVIVDANNAPTTCDGPSRAACADGIPPWRRRTIFSWTMIAASSTSPTANASPASDTTLRLRPKALNASNEDSSENGIVNAISRVARQPRRKHHSTPSASITPSTRLPLTRAIARRMCTEASKLRTICRLASASGPAFSSSIIALISSRIATVLAPYLPCTWT